MSGWAACGGIVIKTFKLRKIEGQSVFSLDVKLYCFVLLPFIFVFYSFTRYKYKYKFDRSDNVIPPIKDSAGTLISWDFQWAWLRGKLFLIKLVPILIFNYKNRKIIPLPLILILSDWPCRSCRQIRLFVVL